MITELNANEMEQIDGGELSAGEVVTYTLIGAAGVATGGGAAVAGVFLLAMVSYLA